MSVPHSTQTPLVLRYYEYNLASQNSKGAEDRKRYLKER